MKLYGERYFHLFQHHFENVLKQIKLIEVPIVLTNYIIAAKNAGKFKEVTKGFDWAQDLNCADKIFLDVNVDILLAHNQSLLESERYNLIDAFIIRLEIQREDILETKQKVFDFHGENHTTTLLTLLYLYYAYDLSDLMIIHGKGSHSRDQSAVISAYQKFIEVTGSDSTLHRCNFGCSTLDLGDYENRRIERASLVETVARQFEACLALPERPNFLESLENKRQFFSTIVPEVKKIAEEARSISSSLRAFF